MPIGAWYVEGLIKHAFKKQYRYVHDAMVKQKGRLTLVHKNSKNANMCMVCRGDDQE